jgi:hypothetical protein
MSVSNVGGHGVTSVMAGTDHAHATSAQPTFQDNQGAAGNKSPKGSTGFPPASGQRPAKTAGPTPGPVSL